MTYQKSPNSRRTKVFSKTDGKCYYCGSALCFETFHIDHMHPIALGGCNLQENLAPACSFCNTSKGMKTIEEWRLVRAFRAQHLDAPVMSLAQIQWLVSQGHVSVKPFSFHFEG